MSKIDVSFNDVPVNGAGTASQISFQNPDFMAGLRKMFGCSKKEQIVGIRITEDTITAYFELDKPE